MIYGNSLTALLIVSCDAVLTPIHWWDKEYHKPLSIKAIMAKKRFIYSSSLWWSIHLFQVGHYLRTTKQSHMCLICVTNTITNHIIRATREFDPKWRCSQITGKEGKTLQQMCKTTERQEIQKKMKAKHHRTSVVWHTNKPFNIRAYNTHHVKQSLFKEVNHEFG